MPEAKYLSLFACDVVPLVENMSEAQLADTVKGLRAIIRLINAEPKRRKEAKERAELIQRHTSLKTYADSLEITND